MAHRIVRYLEVSCSKCLAAETEEADELPADMALLAFLGKYANDWVRVANIPTHLSGNVNVGDVLCRFCAVSRDLWNR